MVLSPCRGRGNLGADPSPRTLRGEGSVSEWLALQRTPSDEYGLWDDLEKHGVGVGVAQRGGLRRAEGSTAEYRSDRTPQPVANTRFEDELDNALTGWPTIDVVSDENEVVLVVSDDRLSTRSLHGRGSSQGPRLKYRSQAYVCPNSLKNSAGATILISPKLPNFFR